MNVIAGFWLLLKATMFSSTEEVPLYERKLIWLILRRFPPLRIECYSERLLEMDGGTREHKEESIRKEIRLATTPLP